MAKVGSLSTSKGIMRRASPIIDIRPHMQLPNKLQISEDVRCELHQKQALCDYAVDVSGRIFFGH